MPLLATLSKLERSGFEVNIRSNDCTITVPYDRPECRSLEGILRELRYVALLSTEYTGEYSEPIACSPSYYQKLMGIPISSAQIAQILQAMPARCLGNDYYQIPNYRSNIKTSVDLVAEVGRFQHWKLPSPRKLHGASHTQEIMSHLVSKGYYEVIHSPFIGEEVWNQFPIGEKTQIRNPASSSESILRTALIQSLWSTKDHEDRLCKVCELGTVFSKGEFQLKLGGLVSDGSDIRDVKSDLWPLVSDTWYQLDENTATTRSGDRLMCFDYENSKFWSWEIVVPALKYTYTPSQTSQGITKRHLSLLILPGVSYRRVEEAIAPSGAKVVILESFNSDKYWNLHLQLTWPEVLERTVTKNIMDEIANRLSRLQVVVR